MMKLAWEYIHTNEKANAMLDDIKKVLNKQKFWLNSCKTISKVRDIFIVVSGIYLAMYLILCFMFNFIPTRMYAIALISVTLGLLITTIILTCSIKRCEKLENKYDELWQQYDQFKKDNNLN